MEKSIILYVLLTNITFVCRSSAYTAIVKMWARGLVNQENVYPGHSVYGADAFVEVYVDGIYQFETEENENNPDPDWKGNFTIKNFTRNSVIQYKVKDNNGWLPISGHGEALSRGQDIMIIGATHTMKIINESTPTQDRGNLSVKSLYVQKDLSDITYSCRCTSMIEVDVAAFVELYGCVYLFKDPACSQYRYTVHLAKDVEKNQEGMSAFKACELDVKRFNITASLFKIKLKINNSNTSKTIVNKLSQHEEIINNSTGVLTKEFATNNPTSRTTVISLIDIINGVKDTIEDESAIGGNVRNAEIGSLDTELNAITPKIASAYREKISKFDLSGIKLNQISYTSDKHVYVLLGKLELPACTKSLVKCYERVVNDLSVKYEAHVILSARHISDQTMLTSSDLKLCVPKGLSYESESGEHSVIAIGNGTISQNYVVSSFMQADSLQLSNCCTRSRELCKHM